MRELRNCLERAAALSASDAIEADQIQAVAIRAASSGIGRNGPGAGQPGSISSPSTPVLPSTLEDLEREHILRVLKESNENRERAAAILGISSRTLYRKLREYETNAQSAELATEA